MEVILKGFSLLLLIAQLKSSYAVTCKASQCSSLRNCELGQECQDCTCTGNYCMAFFVHQGHIPLPIAQGCMSSKFIENLENGCYWDGEILICQCNTDNCNQKASNPIFPNGNQLITCYGEPPRQEQSWMRELEKGHLDDQSLNSEEIGLIEAEAVAATQTPLCRGYACLIATVEGRQRTFTGCVTDSGPFLFGQFGYIDLNTMPRNQFCMLDPHGNMSVVICYCKSGSLCNNASLIQWAETQIPAHMNHSVQCWSNDPRNPLNSTMTQVQGQYCFRQSSNFPNDTVIEANYGALAFAPHGAYASFLQPSLGCRTLQDAIANRIEEYCLCNYNLCNAPNLHPTAVPGGNNGGGRIEALKVFVVLNLIFLLLRIN